MKFIYVFAACIISAASFGQKILLNPSDNITETVVIRPGQTAESHAYAVNNTNATINLKWKFVSYSGSVQAYDYTMCDKYNCYSAGSTVREVDVDAGDSTFMKFGVVTNCVGGTAYGEFLLWIDGDSAASARTLTYNTSLSDIDCVSGIEDALTSSVKVFPNPVKDVLTITTEHTEDYTVTLSDLSGRTVFSEITNKQQLVINTGNLPLGTYLLSTIVNGTTTARKTVVKN